MLKFVTAHRTAVQKHDQYSKFWQAHSVITCNNICCYTQGKVTNLANINTQE